MFIYNADHSFAVHMNRIAFKHGGNWTKRNSKRGWFHMKKTVITVVGKDTVGIMAKVCTYLAENNVNILDISQTIVQDYFNMMMIVDANNASKKFGQLADEMAELGEQIGLQIKMQSEDIFNIMHRI